jgi:biopolymer transport protein ExbD
MRFLMRHKGLEPMHSNHVNVTPLIDVIMCLIIFFLLCGQFAKDEAKRVSLPVANLGQEIDKHGQLTINLVAKGEAGMQPEVFAGAQPVTMEALGTFLKQEAARNENLKVAIRADQSLTYNYISPVLVMCAQANIKSVNFSTRKPE